MYTLIGLNKVCMYVIKHDSRFVFENIHKLLEKSRIEIEKNLKNFTDRISE